MVTTSSVGRLATQPYRKLLSVKRRSFWVIKHSPTIVTIDKGGIPITVSVDRATVALKSKETPAEDNRMQDDDYSYQSRCTLPNKSQSYVCNAVMVSVK